MGIGGREGGGGGRGGCFNTTKAIRWWSGMRNALLPSPGLPPSRGWALLMSLDEFKKYLRHLYMIPHVSVNHTHPHVSRYQLWIPTHLIAVNDHHIARSYVTLQMKSSLILKRNETAFCREPHISPIHSPMSLSIIHTLMSPCYHLWITTYVTLPAKSSLILGEIKAAFF